MIYNNDDYRAEIACERDRTGDYGEYEYEPDLWDEPEDDLYYSSALSDERYFREDEI